MLAISPLFLFSFPFFLVARSFLAASLAYFSPTSRCADTGRAAGEDETAATHDHSILVDLERANSGSGSDEDEQISVRVRVRDNSLEGVAHIDPRADVVQTLRDARV